MALLSQLSGYTLARVDEDVLMLRLTTSTGAEMKRADAYAS